MIQKYIITAEGESRLDIVSRISMLFLQRHIDVESLTFLPMTDCGSCYRVCALARENVVQRIVGQMEHIEGLVSVKYEQSK